MGITDYTTKDMADLKALTVERGVKVKGTGKNGAIKKIDLANALAKTDDKAAREAGKSAQHAGTPEIVSKNPVSDAVRTHIAPSLNLEDILYTGESGQRRMSANYKDDLRMQYQLRGAQAAEHDHVEASRAYDGLLRSLDLDGEAVQFALQDAQVHATLALAAATERVALASDGAGLLEKNDDLRNEVERLRIALAQSQAEARRLRAELGEDTRDLP